LIKQKKNTSFAQIMKSRESRGVPRVGRNTPLLLKFTFNNYKNLN